MWKIEMKLPIIFIKYKEIKNISIREYAIKINGENGHIQEQEISIIWKWQSQIDPLI